MRHKILLALQKLPEATDTCLGEVSEFDKTFVLDCDKGRKLESTVNRTSRRNSALFSTTYRNAKDMIRKLMDIVLL